MISNKNELPTKTFFVLYFLAAKLLNMKQQQAVM